MNVLSASYTKQSSYCFNLTVRVSVRTKTNKNYYVMLKPVTKFRKFGKLCKNISSVVRLNKWLVFFVHVTRIMKEMMMRASRINSLTYKYYYMGGFILDALSTMAKTDGSAHMCDSLEHNFKQRDKTICTS